MYSNLFTISCLFRKSNMEKLYIDQSIGYRNTIVNQNILGYFNTCKLKFTGYLRLPAFFLFLCGFLPLYGQHSPIADKITPALEHTIRETLKKNSLRLQLIENNGQQGLPANVLAYFTSDHQTVFIEKDRLRIVMLDHANAGKGQTKHLLSAGSISKEPATEQQYHSNSFSLEFKGGTAAPVLEKNDLQLTKRNYMQAGIGGIHAISANSYGEVVLKNVYKGINLRLYSQENGQLEFDWIVLPGADAGNIKMKLKGQQQLSLTADGSLQIKLGMGNFNMHLPESYYITPKGKINTPVYFALNNKEEVSFKGFNSLYKKYPLIIDPDLLWGTFFDGGSSSFDEYLYSIEYNYNNQLLYCCGTANIQISNTYAAALANGYDTGFTLKTDALIYALTKNGSNIQYITYLGGSDADVGVGIAISPSRIFTCGYTASNNFPITKTGSKTAFDSVYNTNSSGFVAVFNYSLDSLVYGTYLGEAKTDKALTIRTLNDSSFYVSLSIKDTLQPKYLINAANNIFNGTAGAWIGKFTGFNQLSFGTYIAGSGATLVNDFQLLSNGDVVFVGNTTGITEINPTVPDNGTGQEALFGKIHVPAAGAVSFDILDKIGGSNSDYAWGIVNLGDSISAFVGQTNSNDFPLGTGPRSQSTYGTAIDGFIATIHNDGTGGYRATYIGGSNEDILVSIRKVIVNNQPVLLSFGTTKSTDLATLNYNGGTFFSSANSGGYDMLFTITDQSLNLKEYLSYIGGVNNDYLGKTGAPLGSNHVFYDEVDSILFVGTTSHSKETTQIPAFVGRGAVDMANIGVPVFDDTKSNGINDIHVIFAISVSTLFHLLPVTWNNMDATPLNDCSVSIHFSTSNETDIINYVIERSLDGTHFNAIGTLLPLSATHSFTDDRAARCGNTCYYRIKAEGSNGKISYSPIKKVQLSCGSQVTNFHIYPTLINNSFNISFNPTANPININVELVDETGKLVFKKQYPHALGIIECTPEKSIASGNYYACIRDGQTGKLINLQKIIIQH